MSTTVKLTPPRIAATASQPVNPRLDPTPALKTPYGAVLEELKALPRLVTFPGLAPDSRFSYVVTGTTSNLFNPAQLAVPNHV
jgi:hypothetical protein